MRRVLKHSFPGRVVVLLAFAALCAASLGNVKVTLEMVQVEEVVREMHDLAKYSDDPFPEVTRVIFTENDMEARRFIKDLMEGIGLKIREDAMGNIFGAWVGTQPELGSVVTGSHTDAIPKAGMYDGVLGVIGGIHAIKALQAAGFQPKRTIEVLMFTSEEPTRYGLGCIGSRGMAGVLTPEILDTKLDEAGGHFLDAASAAGYGAADARGMLDATFVREGAIDYFVELHIEQGPLLEAAELPIGVVTAIAAPAALRVSFHGPGGHAGALLMAARHDAALAASELALAVERHTLAAGSEDTVGTTGSWTIDPNAINSVPRHALLEIDVRDIEGARRDGVVEAIVLDAERIAARRGVEYSVEMINQDPPATCSPIIQEAIKHSADTLSLGRMDLVSRAYHDSLFMARIAPTGMIFIPCRGGVSHRPDEFAKPEDMAQGIAVLANTLAQLSQLPTLKDEL